jgi:zinc protease
MRMLRTHALAAAALLALAAPSFAQVKDINDLKFAPLHKIAPAQPKRVQLKNGMVIFLVEDHELPLINGSATIRGGGRDISRDKAGLIGIYSASWRTGGTESNTGDQLDDMLESRAARLETTADADSSAVRMDVLKGDFDTVFPLFVELLRKPAFRQEKIELAKTQARSSISRRNDDPGAITSRETSKLAYGESAYTAQPEYATINALTRDDLVAFHDRFVHPNNIILGFVGDFDTATMENKLRAAFESWAPGPKAPVAPPIGSQAKPGIYFVSKDDVNQTNLRIFSQGAPLRSDPDYYALNVMNTILSGAFSGRLMNHIRTQQGLAYGVSGGVSMNWDYPGVIAAGMATKSGSTVQAIQSLRNEMSDLVSKPFTDEELKQAKDALLNAFVFTQDSPAKALNQRVLLEFYGYPADYYTRYPAMVEKVTSADVARVAKKYVRPDQMAVLVVGNEKEFDKPLATLGGVTAIDVTIPEGAPKPAAAPGGGSASAAPAGSNAAGLALMNKVRDFVGGKAKLDTIDAMHMVMSVSTKTPAGPMDMEMDSVVRYPDLRHSVMKTPMGEMTMVATPDAAFVITPMGTQDLPSSQRESQKNEAHIDMMTVLKNADKPGYTFTAGGMEKVDGVDAQLLEVNAQGSSVKWWVDPATGRVLRRASTGARGEQVTTLGDWKSFNGINVATTFSTTANGEVQSSGKVTSVEVNPTVDVKMFEKPASK